jgi:hypothetical protein
MRHFVGLSPFVALLGGTAHLFHVHVVGGNSSCRHGRQFSSRADPKFVIPVGWNASWPWRRWPCWPQRPPPPTSNTQTEEEEVASEPIRGDDDDYEDDCEQEATDDVSFDRHRSAERNTPNGSRRSRNHDDSLPRQRHHPHDQDGSSATTRNH